MKVVVEAAGCVPLLVGLLLMLIAAHWYLTLKCTNFYTTQKMPPKEKKKDAAPVEPTDAELTPLVGKFVFDNGCIYGL